MCDIWCIYGSRPYGDVSAALCVTLRSVTFTLSWQRMHIKRETLAATSGPRVFLERSWWWILDMKGAKSIVWGKRMQYKQDCLRYLYYTTGNISDVDHNVNNEAEGPFVCVYVKTRIDLYCCEVYLICITAKYHFIIARSVSGYNTITY